MAVQPISVFNQSPDVSAIELAAIMAAINSVSMPAFAPKWNVAQGVLTLDQPAGAWALWLLPGESPQTGDLAYHVDADGVPVMQVFPQTIARCGASLCQAIDHEVKESFGDPTAAATVQIPGGVIVKENCDPVSADGIDLGGGLIGSNFVFPCWFEAGSTGPWDFLGNLRAPLSVNAGGYKEELIAGAAQWQMMALRQENGLLNYRLGSHGRLAYRARERNRSDAR